MDAMDMNYRSRIDKAGGQLAVLLHRLDLSTIGLQNKMLGSHPTDPALPRVAQSEPPFLELIAGALEGAIENVNRSLERLERVHRELGGENPTGSLLGNAGNSSLKPYPVEMQRAEAAKTGW